MSRLCAAAAILLALLSVTFLIGWASSYRRLHSLAYYDPSAEIVLCEQVGRIHWTIFRLAAAEKSVVTRWCWESERPKPFQLANPKYGLDYHYEEQLDGNQFFLLMTPYWFLAALTAVLAVALWFARTGRFSLRQLAILVTAVALLGGATAAMSG